MAHNCYFTQWHCGCIWQVVIHTEYSKPCILRPPIQPEKFGLKLKVVLKV